ncbi:MAG: 50S ribosomal protein L24 [Deltaproteobacteria bacterium]|nr:50S ribosomal protein L24 [Deltaproteobacteria bacterium]
MERVHIRKGDMVEVIAGREKGKTGKVVSINHDKNRVIVEKLNFVKKHQRPDMKGKGGILEKEGSIHLSNVKIICNKCDKGVRIGYKILEDGKKVRICKKCQEILDE